MNVVKLIDFVKRSHATQVRKYTGEPYFEHLLAVAGMSDELTPYGFEIGLCHDIIEDVEYTHVDRATLFIALVECGYSEAACITIMHSVNELTDFFTADAFPQFNRKKRKELEAERLWQISPGSQTIKYNDLIHNTQSIVKYDPKFAVKYLAEKRHILKGMNKGEPLLYEEVMKTICDSENYLKQLQLI